MRIIINSHIEDYFAIRLVYGLVRSIDKALEIEGVYRFTDGDEDIIVSSIKNKNSMRFEVFKEKTND
jgi:hypothetical protein